MSTYDDHRGGPGRPEPVVPAGLAHLLAQLAGPPDHWDRPEGDFGPLSHLYRLTRSERALANSMYRLGSKALARGELERAVQCLGTAAEAGHPGALFRLAVVTSRTNGPLAEVRFLVAEAARHGHGDAGRLLAATAGRLAGALDTEDPTYIGELHLALGLTSRTQQLSVRVHAAATVNGVQDAGMLDDAVGAARLVPVPVQRLARHDTNPGPSLKIPKTTADTEGRTRIRPATAPPAPAQGSRTTDIELRLEPAAVSGLVLPMHQTLTPPATDARTAAKDGHPWWSADALRPARLAGLARNMPAVQQTGRQWETVARARDMLHLISQAGGISTREITRRSGLSFASATRLLHWLRGQHLIESIAGEHLPGSRLKLTTTPGHEHELVRTTLDDLCQQLGAAVYYSRYTDGEVHVVTSASGPTAPPVIEGVPFPHVAHASAVGKSLLAQLDFAGRMDHLARYKPRALTGRTITDPRRLFAELDVHGPQAGQFDLLEYSDKEVCAAFPLAMPGRAACIALSLPAHLHPRLLETAHTLSQHSAGILLALLLADTADTSPTSQPAETRPGPWPANSTAALALP
ncbi:MULTISPECIES: IclR family transcriptional regulator domain-containing protein [unclassified Streptomyces]|uniref:IclR family transcriptional regulator domain-containing protein n=1 Tax=unclassified Streptomyces TaxID=2593676 RepID=UPI002E2AB10A|nr:MULTISPECIES: IclR family transcriptional regulator C-terminal domain-containing protein [unclassified Streptomyces]